MSLLTLLQSGGAIVVSGNGLVYYRTFWEQDMQFLRQSTASQEVFLGPFVSDTDFKTAQTGLTIANTDIKIWKNGAITEVNKNSGGATHVASGRYYAVLDATDTDTVGMLELNIAVSGALPVKSKYYILTQSVYDSLFATSSTGPLKPTVDGRTIDITATGAAGIDWGNVENQASMVDFANTTILECANVDNVAFVNSLNAGAITASSIAASALDNKGNWNVGKSGYALTPTTGLGNQTANITGNLSGSVGSVTSGVTVATNNDKTGYSLVVAPLTSSQTASAVWDALIASYTVSGSFGARVMRLDSASSGNAAKVTAAGHVASDVHELQPAVIDNTHFSAGAIDANALAADAASEIATAVAATQALSRLDSMIESDGAGQFRFDTIALSMGAGGGGGGTDWTANERTAIRSILGFDSNGTVSLPTVGVMDAIKDKTDLITSDGISVLEDRVNESTITMQYNESTTASVNLDEDTTSATLQFVVSRPDGTDILTIANGSITRTASSFTVTITTAVTATLGQYLWSLRDITGGTNRVVTKGVLTVQNAASA